MSSAEGIVGPGMSAADICMDMPACIKITSSKDGDEIKAFLDAVVRATSRHAAEVLRNMMSRTPGADQLAQEFAAKLGV